MPQDARDLKGKTGIRRLINATRYSRDGFAKAFRTEEAFRQESILSVVGLVALFFIPAAFTLKLFAVFALVFLLVTELRPHRAGNSSDEQVRQGCRQLCRALCTHILHLRVVRGAMGRFRLADHGALILFLRAAEFVRLGNSPEVTLGKPAAPSFP